MTAPSRVLTNKSAPLMIDHYDYNRKISLSRRDCSGTDMTYLFKITLNETVVI